tara:strand:- start:3588 stop:4271 length:684 start_codon:yes stop_codon:yes gene_type:complete
MRSNKYLVMKINDDSALFTDSSFSGGRSASPSDNVTNFQPHDRHGSHDNDFYWNSAEELLIGFCRWYNRADEKESSNMGNRIYAANATYRFFRVTTEDDIYYANLDLASYEITEDIFITEMITSWAFKQISSMFDESYWSFQRSKVSPVKVDIVINEETNTWCWTSDYLKEEDYSDCYSITKTIPVGNNYEEAVEFISCTTGRDNFTPYRFGGNDAYDKRKAFENNN